jgi:hypothetical protein
VESCTDSRQPPALTWRSLPRPVAGAPGSVRDARG